MNPDKYAGFHVSGGQSADTETIARFMRAYDRAVAWLSDVPVNANDSARTIHTNFSRARLLHDFIVVLNGTPSRESVAAMLSICGRAEAAANRWINSQPPVRTVSEMVAMPGRVLLATLAPDSYDGGFTFTVLAPERGFVPCARTDARDTGKYRVVSVEAEYTQWQRDRYLSGCYGADVVTAEAVLGHVA